MPETTPPPPCWIEPWRAEHAPQVLELVLAERDEIVEREWWRPSSFFTLAAQEERAALIASREAVGACLARVIRLEDGLAGTVGLELEGSGLTDGDAELGFWVARRFRCRGLARRAARLLLDEGRRQGVRRVRANTLPDNLASCAVLRRLGFSNEGEEIVMDGGAGDRQYLRFWLALAG